MANIPIKDGASADVYLKASGAGSDVDPFIPEHGLPSGAATAANQATANTALGDLTETAPASDTASSGLNGRLQRIAQRITSLIALLPASVGQKARVASLAVTLSSEDVSALAPATTVTANLGTIGGAATAAKQPALGTAGSPSSDVVSVQGIAGGTPLAIAPYAAAPTDRSGTITTGGAAQPAAAANSSRRYIFIQNVSTGDLYISFVGTASASTIKLPSGASYENPAHFCPTSALSVYGATTGQAFRAMEA